MLISLIMQHTIVFVFKFMYEGNHLTLLLMQQLIRVAIYYIFVF